MTDPLATSPGGMSADHVLPLRFSGSASAVDPLRPRHPRNRRTARIWTLSILGVLLLSGGFVGAQIATSSGYDDARTSLRQAQTAQDATVGQARTVLARSGATTTTATAVLAAPGTGLLADADRATLAAADESVKKQATAATALIPRAHAETPAKPFWFWESIAAADRIRTETADARRSAKALSAAETKLGEATKALQASGTAAVTAAADRAAGAEAANVPAANDSVLTLRSSVAQVKDLAPQFQDQLASVYPGLVVAVQKLQQSHADTLSAESGPLFDSRQQIEAFARSLAPGVLIDFHWAELVNGLGGPNNYLSGETAWWYDQGGYASIRLSDSIAEDWPSDAAHAIVAHEVGHAITVRCKGMYDATNHQTAEAWATAWAISMGFTNDANGTSAYGAPPASLIATAATCR